MSDHGFHLEVRDGVMVIKPPDTETGEDPDFALSACLRDQIAAGYHHIVLDASRLTSFPSVSLGSVISAQLRLRPLHGRIRIAGLPPALRETFWLMRLDEVFELFDTVDQAVASFRAAPPT